MKFDYINMSKQSNIDSKINEIKKKYENKENTSKTGYIDTYYILAVPLLGLLIYEFINYKKKEI